MWRHSRRLAAAVLLVIVSEPSCVTAGRRTAGVPLTQGHRAFIASRVSALRGIALPESMPFDLKTRQQVAEDFQREAEAALAGDRFERRLAADRALGLVPADVEFTPASRPFTRADLGVAGTYDPQTKKIVFVKDLEGGPFSELTVAHEYTHQLDDSRHDLYEMMLATKGNSDRGLAVQSLIEGSAMATQLDFALMENYEDATGAIGGITVGRTIDEMESEFGLYARFSRLRNERAMELFKVTPPYLRQRIVFPYVRGLAFVRALRIRRGTPGVDAAFASPPRSTEQILHPEKFADRRDDPVEIEFNNDWLGTGCEKIYEDTLGEYGIRQVLCVEFDKARAYAAASGWGGDRYEVVRAGGASALLWHTEWDTEGDAKDFAREIDQYYSSRYRIPSAWMSELCAGDLARGDGRFVQIRRRGLSVVVVDGAPDGGPDAVPWADQVLDHAIVRRPANATPPEGLTFAKLARPILATDHYDDGSGFSLFGGLLASEAHREGSHNFSLLGGTLLDVQGNPDGGRVSLLFGLVSWRTAPRLDLEKWRLGVSQIASDRDSNSWSAIPIVNFPAASKAPGGSTLRTGIMNFESIYQIEFADDGTPKEGVAIASDTSVVLGLAGHAWVENPEAVGTPYRRDYWYFPFEIGFSTNHETHGPIANPPGTASQPASAPEDKNRLCPGDIETYTKTQSIGDMLFSWEATGLYRGHEKIGGVTNWSALGGLLVSGGAQGDDWMFRTPLAGWASLGGREYLLFLWGLFAIPMGGSGEQDASGAASAPGAK